MMDTASPFIQVSVPQQRLRLMAGRQLLFEAAVSTALRGVGEQYGSECTPRGWHVIRARIGTDCVPNTVFVARRPTGEIYSAELRARFPERDWILTRILWLGGLEPGHNRFGSVDTQRRFIYIHGCPDDDAIGAPSSHGCIKLRNRDIVELFDRVRRGTRVFIEE